MNRLKPLTRSWLPLLLLAGSIGWSQATEMPRLIKGPERVELRVDGKPWLMLGGELRNSSSSTLEFMEPIWPHLESLNLNTVFVPVSWKLTEPQEGCFDFTLVDGLLQQARKHHLRLVLLWMGTWKNGVSGYAPNWVLTQPQRFPRLSAAALSPFGAATAQADARALAALLDHLRRVDRRLRTVLMLQVENEIGTEVDRSELARAAFNGPVPAKLLNCLAEHESELQPYVQNLWVGQGRRRQGTWPEVFGSGPATEDLFMAWHYASFVEQVAAAGKAAYPLPMYVNACQLKGDAYRPGADPCGGPVAQVMDIWMAAAPSIDIYAVDNYRNFKPQCAQYRHRGNPLFMPEACSWWQDDPYSSPAKACFAFGEHQALAFSPFGIDNQMYQGHLLGATYRKLAGLIPLISQCGGSNRMHGFYQTPGVKSEEFAFEGYSATVTYRGLPSSGEQSLPASADRYGCFGLIVQSGHDEFLVLSRGTDIRFKSSDPARPALVNLGVEEGSFVHGRWVVRRHLSGDEVGGQGTACTLTPPPFSKQPVIGEEPISILKLRLAR